MNVMQNEYAGADVIGNPPSHAGIHEFLVFGLGGEEYAIQIQKVQELRGYDTVTHLANAPAYIKGVVNLRGSIVPIIDMRILFSLNAPTYDASTVVVVLNIADRIAGIVVDSVADVVALTPEQIKPSADLAMSIRTDYLVGMGTLGERMLIMLDIDKLLSGSALNLISSFDA